jgi:hypothetical protein
MMPLATKSQKHKRITKYFVKLSAFVPSWQKFLSLLLLFCSFNLTPELRLEGEIKGQFKFFTTDKLGNVFVLTQKNDIQKFDKKGKKLTEANFKVLGDATMIDAGNPLEIYVFYKDQNKLVYFDNMLNYRGETDLLIIFRLFAAAMTMVFGFLTLIILNLKKPTSWAAFNQNLLIWPT